MQHITLSAIQKDLRAGKYTVQDKVNAHLENINLHNERLNVFLEVYEIEALKRAEEIDQKLTEGKAGKLAGLIVGIKDVICFRDHSLSCGSQILNGFTSQISATCVERLLAEDAIIIGRQNCDEFAMGSSNENSSFGPTKNGANEERVPGGSSGASAVAVQMDMCHVSLGSDTGGSVRQPAAFCGVVGLKPTYSRVSRYGLTAYASSFDIIGVLSKSIDDAARVLEVIAGADEFDSTVSQKPVDTYSEEVNLGTKKIGFIKEVVRSEALQPEIRAKTEKFLEDLKHTGHEIVELSFDYLDYILPTYYILTTAEASSNLSRFDGIRYGHRFQPANSLEEMYKKTRTTGFGEEVLRRILLGTFVLSASYYDAFFTQAQKVRRLIREKTLKMFSHCDFVVSPTTPTTAFALGENTQDPLQMYFADLFTVQASLAGLPAISVPYGTDAQLLPIGMQLMGPAFKERELLSFSKKILDQ